MTKKPKLVCVKCGEEVVAEDRAVAHPPPVPPWVLESSARFAATCSNRNQATGREHGIGEGRTAEEALAAYAKDQWWGMQQLDNQCLLHEQNELLKEQVKLLKRLLDVRDHT